MVLWSAGLMEEIPMEKVIWDNGSDNWSKIRDAYEEIYGEDSFVKNHILFLRKCIK